MSVVVTIAGSPSSDSITAHLASYVGNTLVKHDVAVEAINVRDLPPEDLIYARAESPAVRRALESVERAHGIVVITPIYKASFTGVLKSFLDLLPQFGLAGKVVLPLATGGTLAHVLAIDYGLRPVLLALGADQVPAGLFLLDKLIQREPGGGVRLESGISGRLDAAVADFAGRLRLRPGPSNVGSTTGPPLVQEARS